MKQLSECSIAELRQAIALKEQIESLQHQLVSILANGSPIAAGQPESAVPGKRKLSAARRRQLIRILAKARKARWAKARAKKSGTSGQKRHISAKGRAAIAAAARARWARFRAAKA